MEPGESANVAESFGRGVVSAALTLVACAYFAAVFLESAGSKLPARWLPRPLLFFAQDAALFPRAAQAAIEYRAEGWLCKEQRWKEIDTRPYFPIDADDKENRFYRAMHFFELGPRGRGPEAEDRPTMQALDDFLVEHHDAAGANGGRLGGIRVARVSVPIGKPGDPQERYERHPLDSYPESYRHDLYWTKGTKRDERCGVAPP